jgi:hypothetical protein
VSVGDPEEKLGLGSKFQGPLPFSSEILLSEQGREFGRLGPINKSRKVGDAPLPLWGGGRVSPTGILRFLQGPRRPLRPHES